MPEEKTPDAATQEKEVTVSKETIPSSHEVAVKAKKVKVRFSLIEKLVLLIFILILGIVVFIIPQVSKLASDNIEFQIINDGAHLAQATAISTENLIQNAIITEADDFEMENIFQDLSQQINRMENVMYIQIINDQGKYLAFPYYNQKVPNPYPFHSQYKPIGDNIIFYKEYFQNRANLPNLYITKIALHQNKSREAILDSESMKLPALVRIHRGEYYNPREEYMRTISAGENTGGVFDISFPIGMKSDNPDMAQYHGEVHIGMDRTPVEKARIALTKTIAIYGLLGLVAGLIVAFLMATVITAPVKVLVNAMQRVAGGDLTQNVRVAAKDEIGLIAQNFNFMTEGLRERERLRDISSKFAGDAVVAQMMNSGEIKLGGEYSTVTMLFMDIRSFTSTSEKMEPHDVVEMLNDYLTRMTNVILENNGNIDKYVGDEVMAVFGAPVSDPDHAYNACRSAIYMSKQIEEMNRSRVERGLNPIRVGTGINSGQVIAGNMGSDKRMDYTVIGDNVNLAARLCDNANKNGLKETLITQATVDLCKDRLVLNQVDPIYVKGKEKPINIYELLDVKE